MEGRNLLRQDLLYNLSDSIGLSYDDFEILTYIYQNTECQISSIWRNLGLSIKIIKNSLEKLIKKKLILKIKGKTGEQVHLTEKGLLLTLLLDTYSLYAPAAEKGEPVVTELMTYLHMLQIPLKKERLELANQLEKIGLEFLSKSNEIKSQIKEEG